MKLRDLLAAWVCCFFWGMMAGSLWGGWRSWAAAAVGALLIVWAGAEVGMTSTDTRIRGCKEPLPAVHDCEWCGKPVRWDDAQVSRWGKEFWHAACFNAEQAAFGRGEADDAA